MGEANNYFGGTDDDAALGSGCERGLYSSSCDTTFIVVG